ncbi:MAG: hypothetical protein ACFFCW_42080 [Candidatus Hodarchaeota archaeon]
MGNTVVQNAARVIGIRFVGMKWFKIVAHGIVEYVRHAGIGGNGIAQAAINAPMVLPGLVNIVVPEEGGNRAIFAPCIFFGTINHKLCMVIG